MAGEIAGSLNPNGYIYIKINYKLYRAHRLAWLYETGSFPLEQIDHINGIRNDNRYQNLREATRSQNKCNTKMYANNASGFKGVGLYKPTGKYRASITVNNKLIYLGYFDNPELAYAAYCEAALKYHGEFSNLGCA